MEELNNIWNVDDELLEEELINYLKSNLSKEQMHAIEKRMAGSSFVNDGVEGLQQFSSSEKIHSYVQQINQNLHAKLASKAARRKKRMPQLSWELITAIIVILLCLIAYGVIVMVR